MTLDAWLAARRATPLSQRIPVLSYGSNRCPAKISWLVRELGMGTEPVVVFRARTRGVSAVWASGLRHRDGQRPAVLAAAPGAVEDHVVWMATPAQIAVLDRCEGRDDRFRLVRLGGSGITVRTEDGARIDRPWCYLGLAASRRPLLVGGRPVRCTELAQAPACALTGLPARDDGLDAETVHGAPDPDEWPATLFTYGLLQPGAPSWHRVAPYLSGAPRAALLPGAVLDTGLGYPAWIPGAPGETPGVLVPVRDPSTLLATLDDYEGPGYRRVRAVVPADGTVCWAYSWSGPTSGMPPLPGGWSPGRPAQAPAAATGSAAGPGIEIR